MNLLIKTANKKYNFKLPVFVEKETEALEHFVSSVVGSNSMVILQNERQVLEVVPVSAISEVVVSND